MTYFVHSPALDRSPPLNFAMSVAFRRKWDVVILSLPMTSTVIIRFHMGE